MVWEQRDNSGSIFKNDRREKDNHPTHTGTAMIDGREYYISAWVKEGRSGKFFSLAFKPKEAAREEPRQGDRRQPPPGTRPPMGNAPQRPARRDDLDDDIPF